MTKAMEDLLSLERVVSLHGVAYVAYILALIQVQSADIVLVHQPFLVGDALFGRPASTIQMLTPLTGGRALGRRHYPLVLPGLEACSLPRYKGGVKGTV